MRAGNSTNICAKANRANAVYGAHNGKTDDFKPPLQAQCGKAHKHKKGHGKHKKR